MKKFLEIALLAPFFFLLGSSVQAAETELKVENIFADQEISENFPAEFRISAPASVSAVRVFINGQEAGNAVPASEAGRFVFEHTFTEVGDVDLAFVGIAKAQTASVSTVSSRVRIVPDEAMAVNSRRLFNPWIMKAVNYLSKNYGLLGYNINAQLTHPLQYFKYGVLKPTKNGLTMCVSGVLEVMITAFDFYAKETGDYSIYNFLPFSSWNTLDSDSIKAHIWVDEKLKSYGTADAIARFGLGEHVKFQNLEPGSFVNINRTSGSGHAVVFLNFINAKGQPVSRYDASVVGFRYFGAQGKVKKGEGGLGFRHAFFAKNGCPEVPYKRDCNIVYSDDQRILNVGEMLHPKEWKRKKFNTQNEPELPPLSQEERALIHSPLKFDGLTTDDR